MNGADDTGGAAMGELFTGFFTRHYDDVRRYALRRLGPEAADDIAAETFAIAWRRFDRLPRDEPLPWLYGVARNVVRVRRRELRRQGEMSTALAWDGAGEPDPTGSVAERDSALRALERLSETDRELIMLLAWEGLEPREAARVLGCTSATVRVRLHRARRRIERLLESPPPPAPAAFRDLSPATPKEQA
ncbi:MULTISPECIES: RNA polymerase sigma factor [unclassified Nocardiopsis]|uniref:RNA polymerase sigma factor n=1 Tax=Nocardiopsis TaxID=2013 RepID=UPI00387B5E00